MRLAIIIAGFVSACCAQTIPSPVYTPSNTVLGPAISRDGRIVAFASTMSPDGAGTRTVAGLYLFTQGVPLKALTRVASGSTFIPPARGVSDLCLAADGAKIAYTLWPASGTTEEVHITDTATGADIIAAKDNQGCIQPACVGCAFACVTSPHLSPDGKKILYAARRDRPFYVASADGSGVSQLPVYSGALAPGPQRVISRDGLVVFTSSAPSGPTVAPQATDIYVINLDGSNLRQVTKFGNNASVAARNATISADGALIAFESNFDPATNATGTSQIWIVRSDGMGLKQLTTGDDPATNPSIAADGSVVAFVRRGQAVAVNTATTVSGNLTNYQLSSVQNPALSDDGSTVAYALGPISQAPAAVYLRNVGSLAETAVFAPRVLAPGGAVGAAGGASPASGSLVTVYGSNLSQADAIISATGFPLPLTLGGMSLLVNGAQTPLLAITPWQINAQLPAGTSGENTTFQVKYSGGAQSNMMAAKVEPLAPAIFSFVASDSRGGSYFQAAAYHAGTATPADATHPAAPGEALEIYATGLGATTPSVAAGVAAPSNPPAATVITPEVLVGTAAAQILFSGLAPGLAGVYQINIAVPTVLSPNAYQLTIRAGTASSSAPANIYVR